MTVHRFVCFFRLRVKVESSQAVDVCGVLADRLEHGGQELPLQHADFS